MARIVPLVITLVLLLGTCYLEFATKTKIGDLNDKIVGLNSTLDSTRNQLASTKATLKTTEDNLAKETADDEATKAQLQTVQSNLDAANAQIATLNDTIKKDEEEIAKYQHPTGPGPANTATYTQADIDVLKKQIDDEKTQITELNTLKDTLTTNLKDAQSRADDLQKTVDHYKNGTVRNGLQGEVLAYNPGWNFVVISIGDRQGAVENAEMILTRGDSQIGKVRITSVEPSTSVANVIPGSLARGVRIEPGDRVIFPGS